MRVYFFLSLNFDAYLIFHLKLLHQEHHLELDKHGNTSAASIPLALDVGVRDGRIKKDDTLLFEGIGGGFSWGSILTEF